MLKFFKKIIFYCVMLPVVPVFLFFLLLREIFEAIHNFSFFMSLKIDDNILKKTIKLSDGLSNWVVK